MPRTARHELSAKLSRRERLLERLLRPFCGSIVGVRTGEKAIALTFDDGPDPEWTPRVLDALGRLGMRATFFLVGERAARHPELVARIAAEGHEVGSHSWDHPSLPELAPAAVAEQIARTRAALGAADARPPAPALRAPEPRHLAAGAGGGLPGGDVERRRRRLAGGRRRDAGGADRGRGRARRHRAPARLALFLRAAGIPRSRPDDRRPRRSSPSGCPPIASSPSPSSSRSGRPDMRYWARRGKPKWLDRQQSSPAAPSEAVSR